MDDVIVIEIELVNSCFGVAVKFRRRGEDGFTQIDFKHAVDEMYRITKRYKELTGHDVVFVTCEAKDRI